MGILHWPVNSRHKGPVTQKKLPCDDVLMLNAGMAYIGNDTHAYFIAVLQSSWIGPSFKYIAIP